jgi:hypothetical protein
MADVQASVVRHFADVFERTLVDEPIEVPAGS